MVKFIYIALLLVCGVHAIDAYRLLVVFPILGKSHGILGEAYVRNLLGAGHEVTYITPYPLKNISPKHLQQVDISSNLNLIPANVMTLKAVINNKIKILHAFLVFFMYDLTKATIEHENVQKLLNDPHQEFDAVIAEWVYSELYSGFAAVYDCPLIWSSSLDPHWLSLRLIDEAPNPAFVPDFHTNNKPPLTFLQRVQELWTQIWISIVRTVILPFEIHTYNEGFDLAMKKRGRELPSLLDIKYNASMILGNSHAPLSLPIRLPQNYKEIGGYHINPEVQPLADDLQKLMDNSKNGVIYFSMGSDLMSKDMSDELKRDLLEVFAGFKQTVIWKFEEDLPDKPDNVHISDWTPQRSILAHPNCLLFITHGGLLSLTETVHFGVPIIGIPVLVDQFLNVGKAVTKGFGKQVDLSNDMGDHLKAAISDVLNDSSYLQRVKEISELFHDRPLSPGAELVYWVEHVVRTGGAPHLRSPALMVPWYQKIYLDLLALILITLTSLFYIIKKCIFKKKNNVTQITSEKRRKSKKNR